MHNRRPTIAYFALSISDDVSLSRWKGVVDATQERDVNLLCYPGWYWRDPGPQGRANVVYDLVDVHKLDGLILGNILQEDLVDSQKLDSFLERYPCLPMVSIRETLGNIPYVSLDNYHGMREAIVHLIEVHGLRRIAFLRGPESHPYAQERYRAYTDVLDEYGLPFDPAIVTPASSWYEPALQILLDERHLSPPADFEVVVAANDIKALDALRVFQERGVRVPGEVAIVGFNDDREDTVVTPPLTSVAMPFYEQGQQAVNMLLALMAGEYVPKQFPLPARLVVRRSCGCLSPAVAQVTARLMQAEHGDLGTVLATRREEILAEMLQTAEDTGMTFEWAVQLLDSFVADVQATSPGGFLSVLDEILRQVAMQGGNVTAWYGVMSALRHQVLSYFRDGELPRRVHDLWLQAQTLIGESAQWMQAHQAFQAEQRAQMLREISQALITTFDVQGLADVLAHGLRRLGIPSGYLSLYENPQAPAEWSRLVLAYDEAEPLNPKQAALGPDGQRFPSRQLVPAEMWPRRLFSFVIQPLYFQEDQIGFALSEIGPQDGRLYDVLRGEISSALQGALLVQRVREHAVELARQNYILDTFMETVPDRIYFKDLKGRITRANQAHAARLRLSDPAEEIGKTDFDFFPEAQARARYEQEQEIIQSGRPVLGVEEFDGVGHWALTTKMPLRDGHGDIIGTFGISRDITELKQMQETLEQANVEISLLNERLKEENLRMEAELDVTRRLQQMLLPTEEELHQIKEIDIACFMEPAEEVGGDYYDVLQHDGQIKIGIGDVAGHGLESGVVMLMLQTAVRTLQTVEVEDPVRFIDTLNRLLHANLRRMQVERSTTLALLDYDAGRLAAPGHLRLSGQHEQLIVVRKGGRVELLDTLELGFPLGLQSRIAQFVYEMPIELEPGDGVVLYSDGITEAEDETNKFYGLERLCEVVSMHWDKSVEAIKDAVVADVRSFIGQQKVYDDLTLLVIKQK
ncbi:MAG: SpoIIE family protein phosphatase [Thermoflexales bacterium]|nr:SpoIIE family protein phosphatase [Thermoflexales bacterium]